MTTLKQIKPVFKKLTKGAVRPALQNVLVKGGRIFATDLETSVIVKESFGLEDGMYNVNTLGLVDGSTEGIEDFPLHQLDVELDPVDTFELSSYLIESLLPFTSKDETRLQLQGIAINSGHYVACDGHTLKAVKTSNEVNNNYIIPSSSLSILVQLLKRYKVVVPFKCLVNEEYLVIDNEFFSFKSRLIRREYPKWQVVVPSRFSKEALITNWINFKELKPLLDTRNNSSRLEFKNGDVTLIIKGHENNKYIIGNCDSQLDDVIGFNLQYLDRAAGKSSEFTLKYNNELSPVEVNDSIVMPLKL